SKEARAQLGWIKVTHVCRLWRQLALAESRLWAHTSLALGDTWFAEMIRRAGPVPLHIDNHDLRLDGLLRLTTRQWLLIVENLGQIKHLGVNAPTPLIMALLTSLTRSAPLLEELVVNHFRDTTTDNHITLFSLPDEFLDSWNVPSLRRLYLHGYFSIDWTSPLLRNLESLTIALETRAQPTPSCDEVLSGLEQMPMLRLLYLLNLFPHHASHAHSTHPERVVELKHLSYLKLNDSSYGCLAMLGHIRVPESATVDIDVGHAELGPAPLDDLFHSLAATRSGMEAPGRSVSPFHSLTIHIIDDDMVMIRAVGAYPDKDSEAGVSYQVNLSFSWPKSEDFSRRNLKDAVRATCRAFCSVSLHTVTIHEVRQPAPSIWQEDEWLAMLAGATAVRALTVVGAVGFSICIALAPSSDKMSLGLLLPALDFIHLSNISFFAPDQASLSNLALLRAASGAPLKTMRLRKCTIPAVWESELRAVPGLTFHATLRRQDAWGGHAAYVEAI
ncbi:hypothetical protein FA95DRAFT_1576172, partial [Auriscalpium vulgare]